MTETKTAPQIDSQLIWRFLDDNAVVVSPSRGKVRVFNGVGTTIWKLLAEEKQVEEIEETIVDQYNVSPEQARTDLQTFLDELTEKGLLVWE
jgi:hypothetical protein